MSSVPTQIADALNQSSQADLAKVGFALGAFGALTLATLIGFEILRPNNKVSSHHLTVVRPELTSLLWLLLGRL